MRSIRRRWLQDKREILSFQMPQNDRNQSRFFLCQNDRNQKNNQLIRRSRSSKTSSYHSLLDLSSSSCSRPTSDFRLFVYGSSCSILVSMSSSSTILPIYRRMSSLHSRLPSHTRHQSTLVSRMRSENSSKRTICERRIPHLWRS